MSGDTMQEFDFYYSVIGSKKRTIKTIKVKGELKDAYNLFWDKARRGTHIIDCYRVLRIAYGDSENIRVPAELSVLTIIDGKAI